MSSKIGRPVSENSKNFMLRIRVANDDLKKLDEVCKNKSLTRSEVVRLGIQEQHDSIKK